MPIYYEETFGPVFSIIKANNINNIIEIAKFCFNLRKIGRNKKNAKEGIVKMTVPYDKSITFW